MTSYGTPHVSNVNLSVLCIYNELNIRNIDLMDLHFFHGPWPFRTKCSNCVHQPLLFACRTEGKSYDSEAIRRRFTERTSDPRETNIFRSL